MTSAVAQYNSPVPFRSYLLTNPSETIPPTEDLEALHAELKLLQAKTQERAKKAAEDIRTIDESMKRMREKEKGKLKALEKIKRERGSTPLPNGEEKRHSSQPQTSHKPRMASQPVASSASTPTNDSRKQTAEDSKKKKKKRKRDDYSDAEQEPPKSRKMSPLPPHPHPHPPAKANKHPGSATHLKVPAHSDFTLPQAASLLPVRPQPAVPPIPGPSKPTEVTEDFSKIKPPAQTTVSTFYSSIEPWLRPIKEEDVGWLEYSGDDVEPYIIPRLGHHYITIWEDEDIGTYGGVLPSTQSLRNTLPAQPTMGPYLNGSLQP
ncbi:hypothetical protein NLI96_g8386 [Meripilus lineatus]|uniref:Uncharacterized protein n=1 Tax=Meripilus lineatus TaxID=2056292 RepID=A0AAD5YB54_9APHY|nr:hypothetical protein NLI96_g8386 [Physisporinus lineatus]